MATQPLGNCNAKLIPQTVGIRYMPFQTDGLYWTDYDAKLVNFNATRGQVIDPYLRLGATQSEITINFDYEERRGSSEDIMSVRLRSVDAESFIEKHIDMYPNKDFPPLIPPGGNQFHDSIAYDAMAMNTPPNNLFAFNLGYALEYIMYKDVGQNPGPIPTELLHGVFIITDISFSSTEAKERISGTSLWGVPTVLY